MFAKSEHLNRGTRTGDVLERLTEGLPLARLARLGRRLSTERAVTRLAAHGLLEMSPDAVRATARGRMVLNEIVRQLSEDLNEI